MSRTAPSQPSSQPDVEVPNPPPLPRNGAKPSTGSGRTAFLVPTFLGNNAARGDVDSDIRAFDNRIAWPLRRETPTPNGARRSSLVADSGAIGEPSLERGARADSSAGLTPRAVRPRKRKRSRISGVDNRPSGRRAGVSQVRVLLGNQRTLLLIGSGLTAVVAAIVLGLYILPSGDDSGSGMTSQDDQQGTFNVVSEQPNLKLTWLEGEFPRFTNAPSVRRSLLVESPLPVHDVRVNGASVGLQREDARGRGYIAQVFTVGSAPIRGSLDHTEFIVVIEVGGEEQVSDTFHVEFEHAAGTYEMEFFARIDRELPRIDVHEPRRHHRLDPGRVRPTDGEPPSPFLLNTREVPIEIRIRDVALESVALTQLWDEQRIDVPIAEPRELLIERTLTFPDDGEFTIRIDASDVAGNAKVWEQTFLIDTQPPRIEIVSSEGGSHEFSVHARNVTIVGIVADDRGVHSLLMSNVPVRGLEGTPGDATRRFELALPNLNLGESRFSLTALDMAGNSATIELRITYVDPDLPKLIELSFDGQVVWSEGGTPLIQFEPFDNGEHDMAMDLEIVVEEMVQPRVRVDGTEATFLADRSIEHEYVFVHRLEVRDGMQLVIEIEGERDSHNFEFVVQSNLPSALRVLQELDALELIDVRPRPHEQNRLASAFLLDDEGTIAMLTQVLYPELLRYDRDGTLVHHVQLHSAVSVEDVQRLPDGGFALGLADGGIAVTDNDGLVKLVVETSDRQGSWLVHPSGLIAVQEPGGDVVLTYPGRGGSFRLPLDGEPDGPMLTLGDKGRYLLICRGDRLVAWSLLLSQVVAELDMAAAHLVAGEGSIWYGGERDGTLWRFEGLAEVEPLRHRLPGELLDLTRLADGRLLAQVRRPASAEVDERPSESEGSEVVEWHLVAADFSESTHLRAVHLPNLIAGATPDVVWGLADGFVVQLRLPE